MSPTNPSGNAGSSVTYTVSVANHDSSGCAARAFSMSSTQPDGWLGTFSASSVALNPGQTASVTLTEAVPATAAPGTYAITTAAANGSNTGSASANATVLTAPSLTDTTSVPGSSYTVRQTVPATSVVFNGGTAAAGANV